MSDLNLAQLAAEINVVLWREYRAASDPAVLIDWLSTEPIQTLLWLSDYDPGVAMLAHSWALHAKAEDRLIVGVDGAALYAVSARQLGQDLADIDFETLPFS